MPLNKIINQQQPPPSLVILHTTDTSAIKQYLTITHSHSNKLTDKLTFAEIFANNIKIIYKNTYKNVYKSLKWLILNIDNQICIK